MREPYGILVEFISSYNCGGGFWWDRREGFWKCSNGTNVRQINNGMGIWWRLKIEDYWEISKRAKPKSSQRPSGSEKTFLKNRKSFSGVEKHH